MNWFILLELVCCVLAANLITLAPNSSVIKQMAIICQSAPTSNLNLCNNTCLQCTPSSSYKCSSCSGQFYSDGDACYIDNNVHNYTIYNYLKDLNADLMATDLSHFIYGDIGNTILINKVTGLCSLNLYELFIAGPFKDTNTVGIDYNFVDKIDQVRVKFNFISFVQDMTLGIDINEQTIFTKKFTIFSDLVGMYSKRPNNEGPNYIILQALSHYNVGSVISPVDTGTKSIITNKIRYRMYIYTNANSTGYCWGFNDFVVIFRSCETCVTQAVQNLMNKLITLFYVVFIVVIVLLALLFIMIKLEDIKRRLDFQSELGSSDSLPLKAIDRVIQSLQRSTRTMEKEFYKQDRRFKALMKRQ